MHLERWNPGDVRDLELPPFPASGAPPKRKSENGSCQMGRVHLICVTLMLLLNLGNVICTHPNEHTCSILAGGQRKRASCSAYFQGVLPGVHHHCHCLVCNLVASFERAVPFDPLGKNSGASFFFTVRILCVLSDFQRV